jgi:predicted lipid-binding transport protein (Tim44 family)
MLILNPTKLIAAIIVIALIGLPSLSFARARGGGGYGGGYSSGSRGMGSPGSMGSRGSRTYEQNGAKPIEQSVTPKPSTGTPPSASSSQAPMAQLAPAMQPSFMQRNPLLAGLAAGIAGSYIGNMLFGATNSSAATTTETGEASPASGGFGSTGILLILMLLGAGAFYYFLKVRRPAPDFSGISRSTPASGSLLSTSSPTTFQTTAVVGEVTSADKTAFQHLLTDVQTAWSNQDLAGLRRSVTPEMLSYFSTALAEQASLDIANHVDDVVLQQAEVRETWIEDTTQYATIGLRWSARDYTVSLTKKRGEPGYLFEGNEETPAEASEVWTFVRFQNGKWLLSAIQQ